MRFVNCECTTRLYINLMMDLCSPLDFKWLTWLTEMPSFMEEALCFQFFPDNNVKHVSQK